MEAFLTGVVAGYGIAIPVGAIAVLIVRVGIKCGFRCALAAGMGAATADFLYAGLAVIGGAALAEPVQSVEQPLRFTSAVVLATIAVVGLRGVGMLASNGESADLDRSELVRTYGRFVGLTIINPTTIIYFAAVIIGLGVAEDLSAFEGGMFAIGAFLASLSWQSMIAGMGAFAGRSLGEQAQKAAVICGNFVILAFAVAILMR